MLNEHHGTPFCLGAVMNVEASILGRITKKVGSYCSVTRCLLSKIRSVSPKSWRRLTAFQMDAWCQAGSEARAASRCSINANPAFNGELLNEAHDLILAIRLLGQEVLPAVYEYGKGLALLDPFVREPVRAPMLRAPSANRLSRSPSHARFQGIDTLQRSSAGGQSASGASLCVSSRMKSIKRGESHDSAPPSSWRPPIAGPA